MVTPAYTWRLSEHAYELDVNGHHNLDDMTDVDLATTPPSLSDVLTYDGTNWTPAAAGGGGTAFIGARVYRSSNQSISDSTETEIDWTVIDYDTDGFVDFGTDDTLLTVQTGFDGYYVVSAAVVWASDATGYRKAVIKFRHGAGTEIRAGDSKQAANGIETFHSIVSDAFPMVAGDYIYLDVTQTSGGALNARSTGSLVTSLSIRRVG